METLIEGMEIFLEYSVEIGAIVLEIIGVYMMFLSAMKAFLCWTKTKNFGHHLSKGIPHALEFLMCSEVLKTATADSTKDYIQLAVIIALRFALTLEVHWESKNHAKEHEAIVAEETK